MSHVPCLHTLKAVSCNAVSVSSHGTFCLYYHVSVQHGDTLGGEEQRCPACPGFSFSTAFYHEAFLSAISFTADIHASMHLPPKISHCQCPHWPDRVSIHLAFQPPTHLIFDTLPSKLQTSTQFLLSNPLYE